MIINLPDWIIWLLVSLFGVWYTINMISITLDGFIQYKIRKTGTFETRKWIYTRVRKEKK